MYYYNFVLPSFKISGGVKEVLKLGTDLTLMGANVNYYSMWVSQQEILDAGIDKKYVSSFKTRMLFAFFELPIITLLFYYFCLINKRHVHSGYWIFTHYTTFPLAYLIPKRKRMFFVQGVEWSFVQNKLLSSFLKYFIINIYRSGKVLTANPYLTQRIKECGLDVFAELPIWADARFLVSCSNNRYFDFVMVLRKGDTKRLDLYIDFLNLAISTGKNWKFAVISPDDRLADLARPFVNECVVNPTIEVMRTLYSKSRFFLMMSENEGFGLPPLEAMGAGCVPICRDSGGIHAYMLHELRGFVVPLDMQVVEILQFAEKMVADHRWKEYSAVAQEIFVSGLKRTQDRVSILAKFIG